MKMNEARVTGCSERCSTVVWKTSYASKPFSSFYCLRYAKSAGGRLHPNTHTPSTQRSRSGLTMPLFRHIMGTYPETSSHATRQGKFTQPQSSQLADPLWTDPGFESGVSVRELISASKKEGKKERRRAMNGRTFSQNPRKVGKK